MGRAYAEERIKEAGDISAEQERGHARLVGLKSKSNDVAHEPHVLANVLRQSVLGPFHLRYKLASSLDPVVCRILGVPRGRNAFFDFAHTGEIFVKLGLVLGADLHAQAGSLLAHAVQDALVATIASVFEEAVERQ